MASNLVEMRGISKSFPGVKALDRVDFSVREGEIVGLLGENGAGKSTLMKVLTGVYQPDEGEILLEGKPLALRNTSDAYGNGISIIFQELNNCPNLSALENLFLGKEIRFARTRILNYRRMRQIALDYFRRLNLDIDPDVRLSRLGTARQQLVEIAKALSYDVKLLIMDEPTSSLSAKEVARLFAIMRDLKKQGISVIFISHKLEEVLEVTDRVVVLRDGELAGELVSAGTTREELISLMVGREIGRFYTERQKKPAAEVVFEVKDLCGPPHIRDVGFTLRRGEILGMAGLMGAGRTETARLIIGAETKTSGTILMGGREIKVRIPEDAVRNRIAYLPEDRKTSSLVLKMGVRENLTLSIHHLLTGFLNVIDRRREREICSTFIRDLSIKATGLEQVVEGLSGGNQQKVVIGKWLSTHPEVLILDEPTRGIDVGAKAEVHRIISELADSGVSIVLISSELPEILSLSDRVLVMREGRVSAVLDREEADQESIMAAAVSR